MEIGIGLDGTLGLSFENEAKLSATAARLGYTSIWTPEGPGLDSFQICSHRWNATRSVVNKGLTTGISVSPVTLRTPVSLAMSAGTMSIMTEGKFILGIGAGGIYRAEERCQFGLPNISSLDVMRDYLTTVRGLLTDGKVTHTGPSIELKGVRLGINPSPRTPVLLGALGPRMLHLAGELADGAALNWCTPQQVRWSRERMAEGADTTGRDVSQLTVVGYIRVCVDNDIAAAKRAFAKATLGYALGPSHGTVKRQRLGYRAHFERMGFAEPLAMLDQMRSVGASSDELADAAPAEMLQQVGYYGPSEGAAPAFRRLSKGLDIAIVRVVAARPGIESTLAAMRACRPKLVRDDIVEPACANR